MGNFCGKCGSPIDLQTGECPNCSMQKPPEKPEKPKNKNKGKTIGIAVVSVVLCIAIVFATVFGLKLLQKDDETSLPTTTEQNEREKVPAVYGKVAEQYARAMLEKNSNNDGEYVNKHLSSKFGMSDKYKVFFSLVDINKDGTTELIIGGGEDKNSTMIYDIFTNDGEKPIALFPSDSIGDEKTLDVYDNGNIKVSNEQSSSFKQYDYFILPEHATEVSHQTGLTVDNDKYYKHDVNGNYISELSKEEYDSVVDSLESAKIKPEWTELVPEDYISNEMTIEEARVIAEKHWNLTASSDGYYYEGDNRLAIFGDESEAVEVNGVKYYYFRLRGLVDTHWSTWDMLYVNAQTGECSSQIPKDDSQTTDLTQAQIDDFERFVTTCQLSFVNSDVENMNIDHALSFCIMQFGEDPDDTIYDYYFPGDYEILNSDPLGRMDEWQNRCYSFDENKILFVLNDVLCLNADTSYTDNSAYFHNGRLIYLPNGGGGDIMSHHFRLDSYEKLENGYYRMKVTDVMQVWGEGREYYDEYYFTVKPKFHSEYGDYWEIKQMEYIPTDEEIQYE